MSATNDNLPETNDSHFSELESILGITFKTKQLLQTALTHRSYANRRNTHLNADNERLEFFGDAVLKFLVSDYLFHKFPSHTEGDLTKLRAQIISDKTFAVVGKALKLGRFIYVSHSEKMSGGLEKPSILANTFEAIVGAYYLDSGIHKVKEWVFRLISDLDLTTIITAQQDYKTVLQERLQKFSFLLPDYIIVKEAGPDHKKLFFIQVSFTIHTQPYSFNGTGYSKKEAEQVAANNALRYLDQNALLMADTDTV